MNQFNLKTKWVALAFAVLSLFAAYVVAGDHSETAPDVSGQPQTDSPQLAQGTVEPPPPPVEDAADGGDFVDDDSLIDDAGGEDPTPDDAAGDGGDGGSDSDGGDFGPANDTAVVQQGRAPDGTPIVITN